MTHRRITAIALLLLAAPVAADEYLSPAPCAGPDLRLQVLGSGGADLAEGRAASSYLVWIGGKARVLIDAGTGSALRFSQSGAAAADLDGILLTRLRMDHVLDFPAIVAAAIDEQRTRTLSLYGPTGNRQAPSTLAFVRALLDGTRGAYRRLSIVLSPLAKDGFRLEPRDVRTRIPAVGVRRGQKEIVEFALSSRVTAAATYVGQEGPPVLAWRVRAAGRSIVVSGDVAVDDNHLERLARAADLLVVDHALAAGGASAVAVGRIAALSEVKRLVLTQRTRATLGKEDSAFSAIRANYAGPVAFADDLDCFALP